MILARNQAKAKQHPEAELSLFENYSLSSFTLSSKNNRRCSKKCTKEKSVNMVNRNEAENEKCIKNMRHELT